jgi:hypothetical protein
MHQNLPAHIDEHPQKEARGGHRWMMFMCIPMIVIAVTLVATGIVGPGLLFSAIACTAMIALMMVTMQRGGPTHP